MWAVSAVPDGGREGNRGIVLNSESGGAVADDVWCVRPSTEAGETGIEGEVAAILAHRRCPAKGAPRRSIRWPQKLRLGRRNSSLDRSSALGASLRLIGCCG